MARKLNVWGYARVPTYALCYLTYDDAEGITEQDKVNIMRWQESVQAQLEIDHPRSEMILDFGEDEYFCAYPAFGLPTACVKCTIATIRKRKTK